jgi:hypothetical protein
VQPSAPEAPPGTPEAAPEAAPEERPAAEARPPDEAARIQRPPPDIARYEVRFPTPPREKPLPRDAGAPDATAPPPEPTVPASQAEPEPEPGVAERPELDETAVLLRALEDPDPFVRSKAVEGLGGHPEAERAVMAALDDDYPMVRRSAVRALRRSTRSRAAQALVEVVSHDPSAEVREEAVGVLAQILQRGANESS